MELFKLFYLRSYTINVVMKNRNIILDCDPGHDDAIAILLAGSTSLFNLLGISVVSGNQTVEKTARNAFNVSRYLGINVPIAIGADKPLMRERLNCGEIHGESGLDGFDFPNYKYHYYPKDGADLIIDKCLENEKVTIVTTGPMTNLAIALLRNQKIKEHIEEIVLMGGSTDEGNLTKYAEFNILADPDAAAICFRSGIHMKMIGLNVTRQVLVMPEIIKRMEKIHNKASNMFVSLMKFFNKTQKEVFNLDGGPLHDPVTFVSLMSDVIYFEKMDVDINVNPNDIRYAETKCKIDNNSIIEVATKIDVNRYWDIIEGAIRKYE